MNTAAQLYWVMHIFAKGQGNSPQMDSHLRVTALLLNLGVYII